METARETFYDFEHAIELLEEAQSEEDFRVLWVASITLCRAIGHMLKNSKDERVRAASRKLFQEWKTEKDDIFFTFIKSERDAVLKNYSFSVDEGAGLAPIAVRDFVFENDWLYVPFADGSYDGMDARDKLVEARDWWVEQLTRVEDMI